MISRRTVFAGVLFGLAAAIVPAVAGSARYRNVSGLRPGSFVWRPGVDGHAPVTVVVSLAEQMLHVYRGSVEVGFSTVVVPSQRSDHDGSVLTLSATLTAADDRRLWRGTDLTRPGIEPAPNEAADVPLVLLPDNFARLLATITVQGAVAIVARERSETRVIDAFGPFGAEIETGSLPSLASVARFAAPDLGASLPAAPPASAVVVSRSDRMAYHLHNGEVVRTLPVLVENPSEPLGRHALVMLEPGDARRPANWLAIALGGETEAAQLSGDGSQQAMRRIRFADRARAEELAKAMHPGTALILTDDPGPRRRSSPSARVAVLSSGSIETSAARTTPTTAPPAVAEQAASDAAGKPDSARMAAAPRRRRTARKQAADDAWIEKILRPY